MAGPMQAGTGSSMTRISYLSKMRNIPEKDVKIEAKAIDLYTFLPGKKEKHVQVSLAELQLLKAIKDIEKGRVGGMIFHNIVNDETMDSIKSLYQKPSLVDPSRIS